MVRLSAQASPIEAILLSRYDDLILCAVQHGGERRLGECRYVVVLTKVRGDQVLQTVAVEPAQQVGGLRIR